MVMVNMLPPTIRRPDRRGGRSAHRAGHLGRREHGDCILDQARRAVRSGRPLRRRRHLAPATSFASACGVVRRRLRGRRILRLCGEQGRRLAWVRVAARGRTGSDAGVSRAVRRRLAAHRARSRFRDFRLRRRRGNRVTGAFVDRGRAPVLQLLELRSEARRWRAPVDDACRSGACRRARWAALPSLAASAEGVSVAIERLGLRERGLAA